MTKLLGASPRHPDRPRDGQDARTLNTTHGNTDAIGSADGVGKNVRTDLVCAVSQQEGDSDVGSPALAQAGPECND